MQNLKDQGPLKKCWRKLLFSHWTYITWRPALWIPSRKILAKWTNPPATALRGGNWGQTNQGYYICQAFNVVFKSGYFMDYSAYSRIHSKIKGCSLISIQQGLKSSACPICLLVLNIKHIQNSLYLYLFSISLLLYFVYPNSSALKQN